MTPTRVGTTEHVPAHLSRTRHPAPWSRAQTRVLDQPAPSPGRRPAPAPVFVDDSGRRRRAGRVVGAGLGALVFGYLTVVGLAFAGVPLVGRLAPPGVSQLSRPAGDAGVAIGPGVVESDLPPAATGPDPAGPAPTPPAGLSDVSAATTTTGPTTTAAPGQGATTSVPSPASTVPERTHTTGPPTEPPGKP